MLRLFFSLYFVLGCVLVVFVVSTFFLPERLFERSVYQHYERVAEGPLLLLRDEFADIPAKAWPEHVEELGQHYGYAFEIAHVDDLDLSAKAIEDLRGGKPAIIDKHSELDYILLPIDGDAFVIGLGIEQTVEEHAERLMGGFFHMLIDRIEDRPQHEWSSLVADLGISFYFPISVQDLDILDLEQADTRKLEQGRTLGFDIDQNNERYFKRIGSTSKVLQIGPIPNPWIVQVINYLVVGCLAALMALGAFLWLRPLQRDMTTLDRSTVAFGRGDLDTRLDVSKRSPVADLAKAFNGMAERIQHLIGSHKELTNAVSHELRTPIARMRFAIDMLEETKSDIDRQRYMENMRADIDELDQLVNELLGYARLDRERPDLELAEVPLRSWLGDIADQTRRDTPEIDLALQAPDGNREVSVSLAPKLMSRAVSNVLRNAGRYAQNCIQMSYVIGEDDVQIVIDDDGPGIPVSDRERIFEPFTRLDTSRARTTGGHGLGLAIVKRIMEWHQGGVVVDESPLGGARFRLRWPLTDGKSDG